MKIESIKIKNFKTFRDVTIKDLPNFCVFIGANGTGKSTLFSIFAFLHDAMQSNVNTALAKHGGSQGLQEVRSRGSSGAIEIQIQFRSIEFQNRLATYELHIDEKDGRAYVAKEILKYRRGNKGQPWHFLGFKNGEGYAVTNELEEVKNIKELQREQQKLKSNDILAIKGLSQFEKFNAVIAFSKLIENFHISDFHINQARIEPLHNYAEHLSKEGENLALVMEYLHKHHKEIFDRILESLKMRIPGLSNVESKITEEGRVLLKFQDGAFESPFLARYVSDGTIKMLAYLALLYDPKPHPLLCVEEPENQLYPQLLHELAEEFRSYTNQDNQVFVSTHSPDFLNAMKLEEVFWLEKEKGYTTIKRAKDNSQIEAYMQEGDQMGYLWSQQLFGKVDL